MSEEIQSWNDLVDLDHYESENNLLLIDGNNLAFRWLNRNNRTDYYDEYVRTIKSFAKSYRCSRIICCYDFGHSYYRKEIFPEYKSNRKLPDDPAEAQKFKEFFDCLNSIIEQLEIENYKFRGVEADDLITYFAINLAPKYNHTWIISSDRDLKQLVNEKVSIFNMFSRKEITYDSILEESGLENPEELLLAQIIKGDKGDNIPGIEGIGDKRSQDLARKYGDLATLMLALPIKRQAKYIQNLNRNKNTLLLNEKLINLKKYNVKAIVAGKDGDKNLEILEKAIEHSS